jgi:hypothetical protein
MPASDPAAATSDSPRDGEASRFNLDRIERRYRRIYPLKIFLENSRQLVVANAIGLTVAAAIFMLRYAAQPRAGAPMPVEVGVFLVTALAAGLVTGYITLWALTVRRFWKFGGLLAALVGLAVGRFLADTAVDVAAPTVAVLTVLANASPFQAAALSALIALTAACYAHLLWVLFQAAYSLARMNGREREIVRDLPARQSSTSGVFSRFWGFPPLFRFARRPRLRYAAIVLLSLIGALMFSVATALPLVLAGVLDDLPQVTRTCGTDVGCTLMRVPRLLEHFAFLFVVIAGCLAVGWICQRVLQVLLRFSLESLQDIDSRPPVLFLRAFRDDQVPLRAPRMALFGRLLEMGRRPNSLDQLLLDDATFCGPVVGLGSPSDKRPPYGAARGYFTGETWQDAVAHLAQISIFTVLCLDDTAGVWWEVEHLIARRHLSKTLFLIRPRYAGASENAAMLTRVAKILGEGPDARILAAEPFRHSTAPRVIGFFHQRDGGLCIVETSTFSRFAYLLALRVFFRERLGLLTAPLA